VVVVVCVCVCLCVCACVCVFVCVCARLFHQEIQISPSVRTHSAHQHRDDHDDHEHHNHNAHTCGFQKMVIFSALKKDLLHSGRLKSLSEYSLTDAGAPLTLGTNTASVHGPERTRMSSE
jgi:hypothetical protein